MSTSMYSFKDLDIALDNMTTRSDNKTHEVLMKILHVSIEYHFSSEITLNCYHCYPHHDNLLLTDTYLKTDRTDLTQPKKEIYC